MTHPVTMQHRLECGTELAVLVDQVAAGGDPKDPRHQAACSSCQATLAQLEQLWSVVREVARQDPAPPSSLVEAVIRRIRRGLSPVASTLPLEQVVPQLVHALLSGERGTTRIAAAVVADVVRAAAQRMPAARLLGRRGHAGGWVSGDGIVVEVTDVSVRIALHLGLRYGAPAPEMAAAIREGVIVDVESMTGLRVAAVDISVDDVFVEGDAREPTTTQLFGHSWF